MEQSYTKNEIYDSKVESNFHQDNQPGAVKNGYLTSNQAAEYLGCSERWLFTLRSTGQLKYYQYGKLVRFLKTDLNDFMQRNVMNTFNEKVGGYE